MRRNATTKSRTRKKAKKNFIIKQEMRTTRVMDRRDAICLEFSYGILLFRL